MHLTSMRRNTISMWTRMHMERRQLAEYSPPMQMKVIKRLWVDFVCVHFVQPVTLLLSGAERQQSGPMNVNEYNSLFAKSDGTFEWLNGENDDHKSWIADVPDASYTSGMSCEHSSRFSV